MERKDKTVNLKCFSRINEDAKNRSERRIVAKNVIVKLKNVWKIIFRKKIKKYILKTLLLWTEPCMEFWAMNRCCMLKIEAVEMSIYRKMLRVP